MPRPSSIPRVPAVPPHQIWIVAADSARARIFSGALVDGQLPEIEDLLDPDARLQEHDTTADRRGHVAQGGGGHALEPRHTQAEHHAERFARSVCARLDAARRSGQIARIYLIAAPAFLGLLRANLDHGTRRIVREEIASDLTHRPPAAIREALPAVL